ncbi:Fur-regulated basic protein FbpA [Sporosarcina sp. E16_8]|uniref:Fur-regulated basic protein FbpA n=1 Tax=Sporosarcina sp. E16_8 TaxID=2789295 RepID=UPI001A929C3F|nr:Fur-regulated basic protein FbpA [Sporosarcina sp. E16_8]MBO0587940.1 Fur-regulated basic protein FbpA [Sporosarcina sp. E16_8]
MRKMENTQMDLKKEKIIQRLMKNGVFKLHGKHLYELSLYALMKAYIIRTE